MPHTRGGGLLFRVKINSGYECVFLKLKKVSNLEIVKQCEVSVTFIVNTVDILFTKRKREKYSEINIGKGWV